jgi:hypothetical protein
MIFCSTSYIQVLEKFAFENGSNYESNLSILKKFADASSFLCFFGLFIALMTLLFVLFRLIPRSYATANFINKTAGAMEKFLGRKKNFLFMKVWTKNYLQEFLVWL